LVGTAFEAKAVADKYGYDTPLFNALVFKKFKAAVGGRLRFAISGGGPLNGEVQDFIRMAFGFPICQGYVSKLIIIGMSAVLSNVSHIKRGENLTFVFQQPSHAD